MTKKKSKNGQQSGCQQNNQQSKGKKSSNRGSERRPKVSLCVQKFILAKLDPFNPKAIGACVPQASSGSSFKFRTTARATVTIPDGRGLVLMIRPDVSSEHASLQFAQSNVSTGTSDGIEFKNLVKKSDGDVYAKGSPFKDSSFADDVLQQRLIGWGLKITPSGAPLHRQGTMYGFVIPQSLGDVDPVSNAQIGETFSDTDKLSNFASYPTTRWANVGKGETLRLMDHTATTTQQEAWYVSHEYKSVGGAYAGGMVHGIAGAYLPADADNTGSYEVELVAHWECKGREILGLQTANTPDAMGYFGAFSKVAEVAEDLGRRIPATSTIVNAAMRAAQIYDHFNRPSNGVRMQHARLEL